MWLQAKMDPSMAGMMGGPFGADGKENFEKMMKVTRGTAVCWLCVKHCV